MSPLWTRCPANLLQMTVAMETMNEQDSEAPRRLALVDEGGAEAEQIECSDEVHHPACGSCGTQAVVRFAETHFCGGCFHRVSSDLFGPR